MGYAISWVAVDAPRQTALDLLQMEDSEVEDETNEEPFSAAETRAGWTVIWSNDFSFGETNQRWERLSESCRLVVGMVEEHVMFSSASLFQSGRQAWTISHIGDGEDVYDLSRSGSLPEMAPKIVDEMISRQRAEGGRKAGVDYIFDIPLLIAKNLVGFKRDESGLKFTVVHPR